MSPFGKPAPKKLFALMNVYYLWSRSDEVHILCLESEETLEDDGGWIEVAADQGDALEGRERGEVGEEVLEEELLLSGLHHSIL